MEESVERIEEEKPKRKRRTVKKVQERVIEEKLEVPENPKTPEEQQLPETKPLPAVSLHDRLMEIVKEVEVLPEDRFSVTALARLLEACQWLKKIPADK